MLSSLKTRDGFLNRVATWIKTLVPCKAVDKDPILSEIPKQKGCGVRLPVFWDLDKAFIPLDHR